jgi:hypothetical protein
VVCDQVCDGLKWKGDFLAKTHDKKYSNVESSPHTAPFRKLRASLESLKLQLSKSVLKY